MSRKHMPVVDTVNGCGYKGQQKYTTYTCMMLWVLPDDLKHTEVSFSPVSTDYAYKLHGRLEVWDLAIFIGDDKQNWLLYPLR